MPVRHVDTKEFIHTISRSPIPAKNKHHASTIIVPLYVGTYLSMYLPQPHFKNQLKTITIVPVWCILITTADPSWSYSQQYRSIKIRWAAGVDCG